MNKLQVGDICNVVSIAIDYGEVIVKGVALDGKACGKDVTVYYCQMPNGSIKQISEDLLEKIQ